MHQPKLLSNTLRRHGHAFAPVLATDLNADSVCVLDFTAANTLLQQTDLEDTTAFDNAVRQMLRAKGANVGIGGYLEDRFIYSRSQHFTAASETRSLHLGIDVWLEAGTAVFAPLGGTVHSFADNNNFGDYGPTIILQHQLDGITFYTLYGHLTRASLPGLQEGQVFAKGAKIAEVGVYSENGHWPPHLHFQVMASMEGRKGDFPGVATTAEKAIYQSLCPNPNLILQCRHLPL